MVIVNPNLSLPADLPYKKRQRPFYANSPLQQATIRYNEAIRKKYNDIQFAKRLENGATTHTELPGVNTIEISKLIDPEFFAEMSTLNPLMSAKKRASKKFDSPSGHTSSGDVADLNYSGRHAPASIETVRHSNLLITEESTTAPTQTGTTGSTSGSTFNCTNEMFPQLQATINMSEKATNNSHLFVGANAKLQSSSSLETQAINEYEPTIDSAHDMIFGNVMGLDYANYVHGPLWPQQQICGNVNGNGNGNEQPQSFLSLSPPTLCCGNKVNSSGYSFPPPLIQSPPPLFEINNNSVNDNASPISQIANPLPAMGKACSGSSGGSNRRSTSVPRPRTGTQKETLKQAAIRCGIIKGTHAVNSMAKRSHCLVPLHLTPVQSDPVIVQEIFHPKSVPACSSEDLVEFEEFRHKSSTTEISNCELYALHNNKSTPALNIAITTPCGEGAKLDSGRMEKSNSDGHRQLPETDSYEGRIPDNAISCPTL